MKEKECDLVREFEVGESTIRMVYKNRESIQQAAKTYGGQLFDNHSHYKNPVMTHMERYLGLGRVGIRTFPPSRHVRQC